jgi:AcrR family transcriptional regulator
MATGRASQQARTRAQLLAAAASVFAARGYGRATLDEVADAAGFSKGAVYSNFASKEELFVELLRSEGARLVDAFAGAAEATDPVDAMRSVYAGADASARRSTWTLWTELTLFALRSPPLRAELAAGSAALHALVVDLVERQCADAGVEPPLPVDVLARMYQALFQGLWQQQVVEPGAVDDTVFPQAVLFVRQAVEALGTPRA